MLTDRLPLVLMAGLPGAGKTTLAYALGRELGWQVIDKDTDREALMRQGFDDELAGKLAYELSFARVRSLLLKRRLPVILDTAALHRFVLDETMEIIRHADEAILRVILCVADRDLRNDRLRRRPYQHTSIRVDPATTADYLQYFEHLPADKLTIWTHIPLLECITTAKKYIELEASVQ